MTATFARFVDGPLPRDVAAALERLRLAPDVVHVAAMPDVHLADEVCVGTVLATTRRLYPAAVGGDIGCGMLAMAYDAEAASIDARAAARILAGLYERIPRDRHRSAGRPPWPSSLGEARREAHAELGTLGSGNHFVELQRDEEGRLWVMLHSGSRAVGPAVRDRYQREKLGSLDADSDEGRGYLAEVDWAIRFAGENRRLLLAAVTDVVGAPPIEATLVTCHHNHVRRQGELWVHRKGAISAAAGEPGIIPGSMGSPSYHVEGRGHPEALASAAHGAGRRMSRTDARREISVRALQQQLTGVFWDHRRATDLRDEAPGAYKDITRVMRAQRELVRITRRLEPVLSFKAA